MLQQGAPEDFVIATGEHYSVRDFINAAALKLDINIHWEGDGLDEKGLNEDTGRVIVAVDPRYFRPTEVQDLLGDAAKARQKLGWKPRTTFQELVADMVKADLNEAHKDYLCLQQGFQTFDHAET